MSQAGVSPLWYRARGSIFAFVYLAGFFGAWAGVAAAHAPYVPALAALGAYGGPAGVAAATALALACMAACCALRIWGSSYLHPETVWDLDVRTDSLVADGPFRYTRNPLYLGNILMALGFGALAPLPGWIFIVAVTLLYCIALSRREERALRVRYGRSFEAYCREVPALLPRPTPASFRLAGQPSLRRGLVAEVLPLTVFAGMIAVLCSPRFGWWIFLALFVVGGAISAALK